MRVIAQFMAGFRHFGGPGQRRNEVFKNIANYLM